MAIKSYILLELNGAGEKWSQRKIIFGGTSVWAPYCSSTDSTQFNFEHENTCSIACHIGSSFPTFQDMCLHVTVRKKNCFIIFCIILTIYNFFKKNSFKKLFFILLLYYTLTEKLHENTLSKKEKLQYFSNQKFLLIKQLSNFREGDIFAPRSVSSPEKTQPEYD